MNHGSKHHSHEKKDDAMELQLEHDRVPVMMKDVVHERREAAKPPPTKKKRDE